jgi:hypothetical protein
MGKQSPPQNPPPGYLFPWICFGAFLGVSRFSARGVQSPKTPQKYFYKHVENFFQKNQQKFCCQVFLAFFCFIAFSGVSLRWEFKNTHKKTFYKKHCVEKFLQKIRPKVQK